MRQIRHMISRFARTSYWTCLLALALGAGANAQAENYVNWGKKYYVTIPEDWRQIERFNVENFLKLHDKDPKSIDFDVFLCPADAVPFYSQAYVFISAEKVENSVSFADSIYAGMGSDFDKMIDEMEAAGPISSMKSRKPVYDRSTQTITQVSEVNAQGQNQMLTLVMKFYDFGIATFYFYTTQDKYEGFKEKFKEIADSFGFSDLERAAGGAKPKIVDVSDINSQSKSPEIVVEAEDGSGGAVGWVVAISVAAVVLIVIRKRRRSLGQH